MKQIFVNFGRRLQNSNKKIISIYKIPLKTFKIIKYEGLKGLKYRIWYRLNIINYLYSKPIITDSIKNKLAAFSYKPLISIILPVYYADLKWLRLAIKSVKNQWYEQWELCIAVDSSTSNAIIKYLEKIKRSGIKIKYLGNNINPSGTSNDAFSLAVGEYIALMRADDELTSDALYEIVKVINEHGAEFVYVDEDKIEKNGKHLLPFFKPDYSYDLLLSFNYIGCFAVIKSTIIKEIDGFDSELDSAQDYDLFLKVIEKTNKIAHIPKVLYSQGMLHCTPLNHKAKLNAHIFGKLALNNHLKRNNINAHLEDSSYKLVYNVTYETVEEKPLVSIIIPTKDMVDFLIICINSIIHRSTYDNFEIIILNNNSEKEETLEWFRDIQEDFSFIRVVDALYEFNWSRLNNHGIMESKGEVYIFLNNDMKVITANWIERLAGTALQPGVGTVGALLLFEDDTIQHAGSVVGLYGWADHIYRKEQQVHLNSPYVSPMVTRNVLACTGACLAISREVLDDIGFFNENFVITGSDIEISLRAYEKGYRNIYDANTKLYHYESKTRDSFIPQIDFDLSKRVYNYYWENGDPFFNINLRVAAEEPTCRIRYEAIRQSYL